MSTYILWSYSCKMSFSFCLMHVFILTFEWNLFVFLQLLHPLLRSSRQPLCSSRTGFLSVHLVEGTDWILTWNMFLMIVGKTEARGGNPHRKTLPSRELNPGPCCCEATVLTSTPPCHSRVDSDSKVSCLQVKKRNYIFVQNASNPKRDPRCKRRFSRHAMNRELSLGPLRSWWKTCAPSNCKAARFIFSGH